MARKDHVSAPITVVLPPEPPPLTPGAARVLLKILMKAHESQVAQAESSTPADTGR